MALPTQVNNLAGTLTYASSGSTNGQVGPTGFNELGLPIGLSIANTGVVQSANISVPSAANSCFFLVKLSSGTAVLTADITTNGTTPSFVSANKIQQTVISGEPVYLGPLNTTAGTATNSNGVITINSVQNTVALKITNNAGTALTISQIGLLTLEQIGKLNQSYDSRTAAINPSGATTDTSVQDGTGAVSLAT